MRYTHDGIRDDSRRTWNDALASGDRKRIQQARLEIMGLLYERIMNRDPNYEVAGWTDTA